MKNIWKISLAIIAAAGLFASCAPMDKDAHELGPAPSENQVSFTQSADGNIITLTNTSSVKGVALWDLGNGATDKGDVVKVSYPFKGDYNVTLTLYTTGGSASVSQVVSISADDYGLLDTPGFNALTGGGSNENGKTWVFAKYYRGHFGVDDVNNAPLVDDSGAYAPGGWWACDPLGKEGSSMYDNKYTFIQKGTKLIWTNNGYIYTNEAGMNGLGITGTPNAVVGDYDVPYVPADNLTFSLDEDNMILTLSEGAFFCFYTGVTTYHIITLDEHNLIVWCNSTVETGNAWYFWLVPEDELKEPEGEPETPKEPKPESEDAWFRPGKETNLLGSTISYESWFSGDDWGGGLEPGVAMTNSITITIPEGIGGGEWMGQFKIRTGIPAEAWESFDFSCSITSTEAGIATIKMTADNDPGDDEFFYDGNVVVPAGTKTYFENPDKRLYDGTESILLIYDFGRFPAGAVVEIADLCLQRHIPLSDKPEVVNLWPAAGNIFVTNWFSGDDWQGGLEQELEYTLLSDGKDGFELTVPEGIGSSEWMGQFALHTDIELLSAHAYEFSCKIEADAESTITIKLTNDPEEDAKVSFYDNSIQIVNGTVTVKKQDFHPDSADATDAMLIFDFGRTPGGSHVRVTDIVLQEYID